MTCSMKPIRFGSVLRFWSWSVGVQGAEGTPCAAGCTTDFSGVAVVLAASVGSGTAAADAPWAALD